MEAALPEEQLSARALRPAPVEFDVLCIPRASILRARRERVRGWEHGRDLAHRDLELEARRV